MSEPEQKNSSSSTILALYNNMLGGALLSFPILFRDAGLLTGTLTIIGSAAIAFATCRLYILHTRDDEKDVEQSIFRILGKKWETSFRLITGAYIVFLNVITLDLIVDQLYSIIYFFFDRAGSGGSIAPKDSLQFDQFSIQWLTLVLFLPLLALLSIKKVDFLVKLCEYGSSSIFIYMIYVVYCFLLATFKG